MRVAVALLVLTAGSVALRTGALDAGFWIDEAIAVGIASHDLARSRRCCARTARRRSTTCCCTAGWRWWATARRPRARCRSSSRPLAVPAAWWAAGVGGRRAGAVAAAVVAICPFLTYYAQEARMYTLVAVLSLVATAAFVRRSCGAAALVLVGAR